MIPKWDPIKYKARSMEVDTMIVFDRQDCLPLLYGFQTCLQEPFAKMTDNILNFFSEHVNNTDTFLGKVHANIDLLSVDNMTEKLSSYILTHFTPSTTHIVIRSNLSTEYELNYSQTKWLGHHETTYNNSSGSSTLLTHVEQDSNFYTNYDISGDFKQVRDTMALSVNYEVKSYQDEA